MRAFWYHCSSRDHGQRWIAARIVPTKGEKEPDTPRLCVGPTVASCFAARLFDRDKPVYVYRTAHRRGAVRPRDVWDQVITGERWLVPPVEMVLVKIIDRIDNGKATEAIRLYHAVTKAGSTVRLRTAQYARAVDVLGGEPWEVRLLHRFREKLAIVDPETYILEQTLKE